MTEFRATRRNFGFGIAAAAAGLAAPAVARAQSTVTWRMQTVDPPAFVGPSLVLPAFARRVEEMSDGRLKINVFTAGQLAPTSEIPAALAAGAIDLAYTSPTYYTGSVPEGALTSSALPPRVLPSRVVGEQLYWNEGLDEIQREAFARDGVHFIESTFAGDYVTFWSREPIEKLDDLQGKKIRTYGFAAKTMEKLGGAPVFIPHEEVYTSLSQGVIDGSMTASTSYERAKYYEVAPYFYTSPWFIAHGMALMASSRSWDALSDDLKAIVTAAVRLISADMLHYTALENEQMISKFPDFGTTAIAWSDADLTTLRDTAVTFLPEIAAGGPGLEKGIGIMENYLATI